MPKCAVLFVHALTGLHPGSGTALGVVDLPVQRERHTQWPTIPGSSLKGILRETCRRKSDGDEALFAVFGPGTTSASDHAGALSITDARLLAFPVRSLRGVFAWVTCPGALERLNRDLELVTGASRPPVAIPEVERNTIACAAGSPLEAQPGRVMLEEFEFTRADDAGSDAARWIADHAVADGGTRQRIASHLAVLHDDDFTHFARHATEVVARVGLDYERKTVRSGALFYEEFLPPETIFYALALAEDSRRKSHPMKADDVLEYIRASVPPVLQIGGNETIGKGLCAVRFDLAGESGA